MPAAPTAYQRAGKAIQGDFMACQSLFLQELLESHVLPDICQCVMVFLGGGGLAEMSYPNVKLPSQPDLQYHPFTSVVWVVSAQETTFPAA